MIKRILLILLIPGLLSASTLKRLDTLRLMALMEAGVDSVTNQVSLVSANRAVNVAVQQVSADFSAVKKAGFVVSADGVAVYAISDTTFKDDGLIWCRIWKKHPAQGTQNLTVLKVVPADSVYEYVEEGKSLPETDAPTVYVYSSADSLYVAPVPNYVDTIKYGYYAIGRFLSGDTATTDILPKYRHLVVIYAAYLIKKDLKQDYMPLWTEYQAALLKRTGR